MADLTTAELVEADHNNNEAYIISTKISFSLIDSQRLPPRTSNITVIWNDHENLTMLLAVGVEDFVYLFTIRFGLHAGSRSDFFANFYGS